MRAFDRTRLSSLVGASIIAASMAAGPAIARQQDGPVDLTAQAQPAPAPRKAPVPVIAPATTPAAPAPQAPATVVPSSDAPPMVEEPDAQPVAHWTLADAQSLLTTIRGIGAEGLFARDYEPAALSAAIKVGEGEALDKLASRLFIWLAEDLRDGRTPMTARVQWFAVDPDQDMHPNSQLLAQATETHDVKGVLASLAPKHPDYAMLKDMLTKTKDPKQIAMIRANMDRWRWLGQNLGLQYLMINVPEQELRLTVNNQIIRTYRAVVGKPGRTATPQLSEMVENVVFNPTWTVPQSIVKGEGLGARLLNNPAQARREGYVATKSADGTITVVQQPGENNALGRVKLDMPNEHAIYIHDTPSRHLFAQPARALSHGCIRAERATELAMTMAILGSDLPPETAVEYNLSGKYTKVPMTKPWPVYVTYFTVARDVNGTMRSFADLYGRDAPVIASLAAPRALHTSQRKSTEAIIKLDNPL